MKKSVLLIIAIFLVVIMVLAVGCAQQPASPAAKPSTPTAQPQAAVQKLHIRSQAIWPQSLLEYQQFVAKQFPERVKQLTGGRIEIESFAPGALVPNAEILDAIGKGAFEMSTYSDSYAAGKVPVGNPATGLPFAFNNQEQTTAYYFQSDLKKIMNEVYAPFNVVWMAGFSGGPHQLMSKAPIRTAADFKGKKMRVLGTAGAMVRKLGTEVVTLAGDEVYLALSQNTVEGGAYCGAAVEWDLGWHEVTKYYLLEPAMLYGATGTVIINKNTWNSLSDAERGAIEVAAREMYHDTYASSLNRNAAALEKMKAKGVTAITMAPEEQQKMMAAAIEVWNEEAAKSPASAQAIQIIKNIMGVK